MRNHQEKHILDGLQRLLQCPQSDICFFANYFIILLTLCNSNNNNIIIIQCFRFGTFFTPLVSTEKLQPLYLEEGKCPIRAGNYNSIPPLFAIFIAIPFTQEYTFTR